MEIPSTNLPSYSEYPAIAPSLIEPCWYAVYTCANHEKRVASQLEARGFEHFLPLYGSVRRWKDRSVSLELASKKRSTDSWL